MSDTIDQMHRVLNEALELAGRKNNDYGDAWRMQGWRGNLSRIFEKTQRLRTLLWNGENTTQLSGEEVRETAVDIINTLTFFVLNHEAGVEWGHETPFPPMRYQVVGATYPGDAEDRSVAWVMGVGQVLPRPFEDPAPTENLQTIHDALAGQLNQEPFDEGLPAANGELPVRDPGAALKPEEGSGEKPATTTEKPSPVRRQPTRKN